MKPELVSVVWAEPSVKVWTHHPAEVFIQNLHKVMNQLVDGQLVLRETDYLIKAVDHV